MAQEWCVLYGILDYSTALSLYEKICKRKGKPMENISPMKATKPAVPSSASKKSAPAAATSRKRKAIIEDDELIADTGMEGSSGWEGSGTIGI
jgi:hypothetical protein